MIKLPCSLSYLLLSKTLKKFLLIAKVCRKRKYFQMGGLLTFSLRSNLFSPSLLMVMATPCVTYNRYVQSFSCLCGTVFFYLWEVSPLYNFRQGSSGEIVTYVFFLADKIVWNCISQKLMLQITFSFCQCILKCYILCYSLPGTHPPLISNRLKCKWVLLLHFAT